MIHYGDTKKLEPRTACGLNFNLLLNACLSGDVDSVDCANCLASNECKAEAMERSLRSYRPPAEYPFMDKWTWDDIRK